MLKYVLAFFTFVIFSVLIVNAEEKSWYEIDGIKFRYGDYVQDIRFKTYDNENYSQENFMKPNFKFEGK